MTRRRFNDSERAALFLATEGRCALCGEALPAHWHADHVLPHTKGGATDVINGQALCPDCNLHKGAQMDATVQTVATSSLRQWQKNAIQTYQSARRRDFLCVATPGAGKTRFALALAAMMIESGAVRRVVVVVPTRHLRTQWMEAAGKVGIQLDEDFANREGEEARDFDGVVITYQQCAKNPTIHRAACRTPTFVIFDELHHSGMYRSWGEGLVDAFEHAEARLSITGTPFRSDNNAIPFVQYDGDGRSVADYGYGYGQALRDEVCRPVYFPSFDGNMRWWSERGGEISATFRDDIPTDEDVRRLNTALDPKGEWLPGILREADRRLIDLRQSQYEHAAGLVIAKDQDHARSIAKLLHHETGEVPALAVSDDPGASAAIDLFAHGRGSLVGDPLLDQPRWIVAVKMVSEGVDIPRLFVGVYATNVMTELYFRQVVGRFVRMMDGVGDQAAYLFIPEVDRLIEYVMRIKEERDHILDGEDGANEEEERAEQQRIDGVIGPAWLPMAAQIVEGHTYHDGERVSPIELVEARKFLMASGLEGMRPELVAMFMKKHLDYLGYTQAGQVPTVQQSDPAEPPLSRRKSALRKDIQRLVNRFCAASGCEHKMVYASLNRRTGTNQEKADEDQLKERKAIMKGMLELATASERRLSEWEWDEVIGDGREPAS